MLERIKQKIFIFLRGVRFFTTLQGVVRKRRGERFFVILSFIFRHPERLAKDPAVLRDSLSQTPQNDCLHGIPRRAWNDVPNSAILRSRFSFLFSFFTGLFYAGVVHAASTDVACAKYKYPWCEAEGAGTIAGFVTNFFQIALAVVGIAAFGVIIYGAIVWTVSGAIPIKQDAKELITGAVFGVVLLLSAVLILNVINPNLTDFDNPILAPLTISVPSTSTSTPPDPGQYLGWDARCGDGQEDRCRDGLQCIAVRVDSEKRCVRDCTPVGSPIPDQRTPCCAGMTLVQDSITNQSVCRYP